MEISPTHDGLGVARPTSEPVAERDLRIVEIPGDEHEAAGRVWRQLEARGAETGPFVSWEWTRTWLEHFGSDVPHSFLVVTSGEQPVGAVLATRDRYRRGPVTFRRLHLGTAGEPHGESVFVERNGVLARAGALDLVAGALTAHVSTVRTVDEVALDGFTREHAAAMTVHGTNWELEPERCHVADLRAADGGDVTSLFSSGVRKEVRRALASLGPLTVEWAHEREPARAILDQLIDVHQDSWRRRGGDGAFATDRLRRFHRALVAELMPSGRAVLMRVTTSAGLLGCRYGFVEGKRILGYQSAWVPPGDSRISAGLVLQYAALQEAAQRGFEAWDYLAGSNQLKQRLSTDSYELVWATHRRNRVRWAAVDSLRAARRLRLRLLPPPVPARDGQ